MDAKRIAELRERLEEGDTNLAQECPGIITDLLNEIERLQEFSKRVSGYFNIFANRKL